MRLAFRNLASFGILILILVSWVLDLVFWYFGVFCDFVELLVCGNFGVFVIVWDRFFGC